jgi:hypothetical protein
VVLVRGESGATSRVMRRLFWLSAASVGVNVAVGAGLYVPGAPSLPVFWLPLLLTFGCAAAVWYQLRRASTSRPIRLSPHVLWELLRELPVYARVFVGVLLLATLAQMVLNESGMLTLLKHARAVVSICAWNAFVLTMLARARWLRLTRPTPASPVWTGRTKALFYALDILVGLAFMVTFLIAGRDSFYDSSGVHKHLATAFGSSVWYPHLVAANADHGVYDVYLDTRDPAVLSAACRDLLPEAAKLERRPDLYYATDGHGYFIQTCG